MATQLEKLFEALENKHIDGLSLSVKRTEDGARHIVVYRAAESPFEAGLEPLGFVTVNADGSGSPVAAPDLPTDPNVGERHDAAQAFLDALAGR